MTALLDDFLINKFGEFIERPIMANLVKIEAIM